MAKEQIQWALSGMTCAGCAHSAHSIAEGTPGMEQIQVRYASGSFKATVDKEQDAGSWKTLHVLLLGVVYRLSEAAHILSRKSRTLHGNHAMRFHAHGHAHARLRFKLSPCV